MFPPEEQGLSWMSHHQQTALITPTSLIKDTHLFLCPVCAAHDVCVHYKQWLTHTFTWAHTGFYITPFANCITNWNKVGFNISQLCLFGFHMRNPPGSYARSLYIQTPSINLCKLDTFFNKPHQHLPNQISQERVSVMWLSVCVFVGACKSVSGWWVLVSECATVVHSSPLWSIVCFNQ